MNSKGIHHITAIAGNPQTNLDFYSGLLELRFIKKTINFDDPGTYHFYYGDETGNPGTILTFFPWGRDAHKGRRGRGQVGSYAFSIPLNSLEYWEKRLIDYKVIYTGPYERFGEKVITFEDPDGIEVELIESPLPYADEKDERKEHGIRGFHSASLSAESQKLAESVIIDILGFRLVHNEDNRFRYAAPGNDPGSLLDVIVNPDALPGYMGVGAVHHIAFRAETDEVQASIRRKVEKMNINITPVIDRKYFHSVYFREPNGILFEVATDPPGFLVDEDKDNLGRKLQLPEWLESKRDLIEKSLYPLSPPSPRRIFLSE